MPVFLDTNIFLYVAGGARPEREACIALLRRVSDGSRGHSQCRSGSGSDVRFGAERPPPRRLKAGARLALFPGLFLVTRQDMLRACGLLERYPRLPVRGAIHVATMLNNGLQTVVSVEPILTKSLRSGGVAPGSA